MSRAKRIFIVAGEHSGDVLGAKLMAALKDKAGVDAFAFDGVGGEHMEAAGLSFIFPLSDVAVMGPAAILARLPKLVRRVYRTVDVALAFNPDGHTLVTGSWDGERMQNYMSFESPFKMELVHTSFNKNNKFLFFMIPMVTKRIKK